MSQWGSQPHSQKQCEPELFLSGLRDGRLGLDFLMVLTGVSSSSSVLDVWVEQGLKAWGCESDNAPRVREKDLNFSLLLCKIAEGCGV